MKIKPMIKSNVSVTSHPLGCHEFVKRQIDESKNLPAISNGPKNVLIIGGSSGYGLASRIVMAHNAGANTTNVSFESKPAGSRTGSAGFWNNIFFQQLSSKSNGTHHDIIGDAFSQEVKNEVINYYKSELKEKIDLVIYSLASGVRLNSNKEAVRSSLKPIDEKVAGKTIDIAKGTINELIVEPASEEEINNTVFVMGGEDWEAWITQLSEAGLLSKKCKTISYTYIGGETTEKIYRHGTIGKAKEHLETTCQKLNNLLQREYEGEALISSSKAVTTKASVFIPSMPVYAACLCEVMTNMGLYETIFQHKYRLFNNMVYGKERVIDELGRLRPDNIELRSDIQEATIKLMKNSDDIKILSLSGAKVFIDEFYQINGFRFDNIDYEAEVNMEELSKITLN